MPESEAIEFKKSLAELSEGLISIAAILNKHGGGELWFGVKNDGRPVGMDVSETTLRKVSQAIAAHIEPKIYPEVSTVTLDGKSCIRVGFSGSHSPYFAHGRAYMRVADEDRQLSAKELESLILKKNRTNESWDAEAIADPKFQPSIARLRTFVRRAGLTWSSAPVVLDNLGLRVGHRYRNAAALFFARKPSLTLRCAVFATATGSTLLDQHDFTGDLPSLIDEAEKYILRNIRIGMRLDGLVRVDVPEIPTAALREAIVNAFCHRDYRDPDEVRVAIFPDRVEIRNPGSLPEGFTIDDLRSRHISHRRNPVVGSLLQRLHLIEAWGHGLSLILENAPHATFQQVAHVFITTFPRNPQPESGLESQVTGQVTGQVAGEVTGEVTGEVKKLLMACREATSRTALQKILRLTGADNFRRLYLVPALEAGLIEMTLPDKPNSRLQKYRLTAKGRAALSPAPNS